MHFIVREFTYNREPEWALKCTVLVAYGSIINVVLIGVLRSMASCMEERMLIRAHTLGYCIVCLRIIIRFEYCAGCDNRWDHKGYRTIIL